MRIKAAGNSSLDATLDKNDMAIDGGPLKYLLIRQELNSKGELGDLIIKEFSNLKMDRHDIGFQIDRIETYHEKFKVRLSSYVEALKIDFRSRDIISFYTSIINDIGYSIVLNCDKDEIFQSFFYALQFGLNHFKLASNPNKEREIQVGKTTIKTVGKETRDYTDFGTWMTVLYTAVILRDKKAIDFLTGL